MTLLFQFLSSLFNSRPSMSGAVEGRFPPLPVQVEFIGRSASGKTTLDTALSQHVFPEQLPSGLQIAAPAGNPAAAIARIHRNLRRENDLQSSGMGTTVDDSGTTWMLADGELPRVKLTINECIGQVLMNPDASPEFRKIFQTYVDRLQQASAIWICIPWPNGHAKACPQFHTDIQTAQICLRTALEAKALRGGTLSVCVLLTQIDRCAGSAEAAQRKLPDEELKKLLKPLVDTIRVSRVVNAAIILPVSAMGFSSVRDVGTTAVDSAPLPGSPPPAETAAAAARTSATLLKAGAQLTPFNLQSLVPWSILHAILPQNVDSNSGQATAMKHVVELLNSDLENLSGWHCQLR